MSKSFIIKKEELKTSNWGGGSTTELFIYPKKSSFKNIDFDFRLSTASVEINKSDFTPLPGVHRKLLLLEGELKLSHQGHHSRNVPLYDVDEFEGDWNTQSEGKAIDFNIMTTKENRSKVTVFEFYKNTSFRDRNLSDFIFIYLYDGTLDTEFGKMSKGDLLVINDKILFEINTLEKSTLVHLSIDLLD